MKKIKFYSFYVLCLVCADNLSAQTTNTGTLVSMPGTVWSTLSRFDNLTTGDLVNDGELYVYDHLNNDGLMTFSNGTTSSNTIFQGTFGFQSISGNSPIDFFDVQFNNSTPQPAFRLSNEILIFRKALFTDGIVDTDNFGGNVIFENGAYHTFVNDNSYVDGIVQKRGSESFVFPIGDSGQYRYSAISDPSNNADLFESKYFFEDSNALYPHANRAGVITLIDNTEYWEVNKVLANDDVFLTLSWDADTTPPAIFSAPYDEIHIVRWDATQNLWVDEGGVANPSTNEVTTVVNPLLGYGIFTLARVKSNNILPCGGRGVVIYNAVSPNGDGVNDYFVIDGIDTCPNNTVEIYNRWGVKVYETQAYNTNGNVFKGYSEGRMTLNSNETLPTGTYFYIISFLDDFGGTKTKKAGYLYINDK